MWCERHFPRPTGARGGRLATPAPGPRGRWQRGGDIGERLSRRQFVPSGSGAVVLGAGDGDPGERVIKTIGGRARGACQSSGVLLSVFAVTMTVALGPEPPLSYSVWSAAAGAFLLASLRPAPGDS